MHVISCSSWDLYNLKSSRGRAQTTSPLLPSTVVPAIMLRNIAILALCGLVTALLQPATNIPAVATAPPTSSEPGAAPTRVSPDPTGPTSHDPSRLVSRWLSVRCWAYNQCLSPLHLVNISRYPKPSLPNPQVFPGAGTGLSSLLTSRLALRTTPASHGKTSLLCTS